MKKYEDLKNNLENLRLRLRRKSSDIDGRNKLEALLKKKESLQRSLEKGNENSQELSANLDNLRRQNEELSGAIAFMERKFPIAADSKTADFGRRAAASSS